MLISLIIGLVVLGLVYWLLTMLPLPEPIPLILRVVFILIVIVWILQSFGVLTGFNL